MFYLDFVLQNMRTYVEFYGLTVSYYLLISQNCSSKSSKIQFQTYFCQDSAFYGYLIVQNVEFTLNFSAILPWGVRCNIPKYCTWQLQKFKILSYFSEIQYFDGDYMTKLWKSDKLHKWYSWSMWSFFMRHGHAVSYLAWRMTSDR